MAFDLAVGLTNKIRDTRVIVGSIEFNERPSLSRLILRVDSFFLHRVSNVFEDQCFSLEEIDQALEHLLPLLPLAQLHPDERTMLHKLVSALSYAKWQQRPLYGIAD